MKQTKYKCLTKNLPQAITLFSKADMDTYDKHFKSSVCLCARDCGRASPSIHAPPCARGVPTHLLQ